MFSPGSSNLQDLDLAGLADGLSKPPPFGVSPSLMLMNSVGNAFYANVCDSMRLEELINAMLRECMRISANVRDYAIFYWRFCSSRIESQRGSGQDVCCTGTGKPAPVQHRPLLTCGSTASCSARLTVAAASHQSRLEFGIKEDKAPKGEADRPRGCPALHL